MANLSMTLDLICALDLAFHEVFLRYLIFILLVFAKEAFGLPVISNVPGVVFGKDNNLDIYAIDQVLSKTDNPSIYSISNHNQTYIVTEERAKPVGSITVNASNDEISSAIESALNQLLGKANNSITRNILYSQLAQKTKEKGFPQATWTLQLESKALFDDLSITVKLGPDCTIDQVTWPEDLRNLVSKSEFLGEICDTHHIQYRLEAIEESIRKLGYDEVRMRFDKFEYYDSMRSGNMFVSGQAGIKSSYRIIDENSTTKYSDIISESNSRIQPRYIAPDAVANELISLYKSLGYMEVTVSQPVYTMESDIKVWTWRIKSGPKTTITKVSFDGMTALSPDTAMEFFGSGVFGQFGSLTMAEFTAGIEALTGHYKKLGYHDIKIRDPRISRAASNTTSEVVVFIDEGYPWVIDKIEFKGNQLASSKSLEKLLEIQKSHPFDKTVLPDIQSKIKSYYYSLGLAHAEVRISSSGSKQRKNVATHIVIDIFEGPVVQIGTIAVIGLGQTHEKIVMRELDFKTGDPWDPEKIESTRKKLAALGIFKIVSIVATDPNAYNEKRSIIDLSIIIKESKPGTVSFGPGYDISKGFRYIAEGSYNNLFGLARQVSIRAGFSEEKQQGAIGNSSLIGRKLGLGYVEPWIFDIPISGRISASHRATATNFWQINNQIEGELSWKLSYFVDTKFAVFLRNELNKEVGPEKIARLYLASGSTRKGVTGWRLSYDGRDNISFPTKGVYVGLENELADYRLVGDYKYHKLDINTSAYLGISPKLVYAVGINWASYWSVDLKSTASGFGILPASDRLLAGGGDYVKGFEKQLGPYLQYPSTDPNSGASIIETETIGGTTRFILKQEIRYKTSEEGAVALQVDAGNCWSSSEEKRKFNARFQNNAETSNTRLYGNYPLDFESVASNPTTFSRSVYWSTGISYNYFTAVGALRLGWALPVYEPGRCLYNSSGCLVRARQAKNWYNRGQFELSVGTKF